MVTSKAIIGEAYLDEPAYVLFEKPIAVQLARIYEKNNYIDKLSELAEEFLHRFPYEPVASQMTSLGHAWFVAVRLKRFWKTSLIGLKSSRTARLWIALITGRAWPTCLLGILRMR